MVISSKVIKRVLMISLVLLLMPFIAMQFTNEVQWTLLDFTVAFLLFSGFGLLLAIASRKVTNPKYKLIVFLLIITVFLLIWIQLAVGIIDF